MVLLLVLGLVAAACNDDGGGDGASAAGSSSSTSSTASTGSTSTTETTVDASAPSSSVPCPANTDPQNSGARQPRAELTAVRAAHQPNFDRVVFEFDGTAPGFRVAYGKRPVTEDASGKEVTVQGKYVLEVRMENASGYHLSGDDSHSTYNGPKRIRPSDTLVVEELVWLLWWWKGTMPGSLVIGSARLMAA